MLSLSPGGFIPSMTQPHRWNQRLGIGVAVILVALGELKPEEREAIRRFFGRVAG